MDESITTELAGMVSAGSRELDRVCEDIATRLFESGALPEFEVVSADFAADPFLICADRYWRLRMLERPTVTTAVECARWLRTHVAEDWRLAVRQKWSLGYAFITKDNVESPDELAEATSALLTGEPADVAAFAALYHAGKLRANFWFDDLYSFVESSPLAFATGAHQREPIFVALRAFGAFGSRAMTVEHARGLLDTAWRHQYRDSAVVDVCVNALAAAKPFDEQGELLRTHAEQAIAEYGGSHIFYFRLAAGQRMCEHYDHALDSIDNALRSLPATGSRGSHKELQTQYIAERGAILEGRQRATWTERQQRRWAAQDAENAELQRTMRASTVRAVELVTIFTGPSRSLSARCRSP